MQGITFGSLTAKSLHQVDFKELDLNADGIITEEELAFVLEKKEFDVLNLSSIDKDADQKVTQEEYELWQQEAEMNEYLDELKDRASRDMVGQSPDDIKKFIDKLNDFGSEYKEEYIKFHGKNLSGMSKSFIETIAQKYNEIKRDVLSNTKISIKARVIENVITSFMEQDKKAGNTFLSLVDKKASSLSDNAKRLLTSELGREADKFIKKYEGDDLEKDLTVYLEKYLSQSDKEKLADAIGVWEKGKEELENLPEEIKFQKLKAKAKNLLITAIENGISLKVGDIIVRSEAMIPAALGQFKDSDSLKWGFDKAINEMSRKTRAQEIQEQDEERRKAAVEQAYQDMQKEEGNNIFQ